MSTTIRIRLNDLQKLIADPAGPTIHFNTDGGITWQNTTASAVTWSFPGASNIFEESDSSLVIPAGQSVNRQVNPQTEARGPQGYTLTSSDSGVSSAGTPPDVDIQP
jgi:hypothetical protein